MKKEVIINLTNNVTLNNYIAYIEKSNKMAKRLKITVAVAVLLLFVPLLLIGHM